MSLGLGALAEVAKKSLPGGGIQPGKQATCLGPHPGLAVCPGASGFISLSPSFLIQRMEPMMTQPPLWVMVECSEQVKLLSGW